MSFEKCRKLKATKLCLWKYTVNMHIIQTCIFLSKKERYKILGSIKNTKNFVIALLLYVILLPKKYFSNKFLLIAHFFSLFQFINKQLRFLYLRNAVTAHGHFWLLQKFHHTKCWRDLCYMAPNQNKTYTVKLGNITSFCLLTYDVICWSFDKKLVSEDRYF